MHNHHPKGLRKTLCLALALVFCLAAFAACGPQSGNGTHSSGEDSSGDPADQTGVAVTFGEHTFTVDAINAPYEEHDAVLYDRTYTEDGEISLYAPGDHAGRYVFVIKYSISGDIESYSLQEKLSSKSAKEQIAIPVNGFVLSVKHSLVPSDMSLKDNEKADVSGYDEKPGYERFDLSSVIPEDKTKSRRVNMRVPEDQAFLPDKIYYISETDTVTVPENALAVVLGPATGANMPIETVARPGETVSEKISLLFTGKYNVLYAEEFYKEGKVYFARLQTLNNITDTAAVKIGDKYYTIEENRFNVSGGEDGIFLYTPAYHALVTDARNDFLDVVVTEGRVCHIGENTRTLIPGSHGFVLSFAGESKAIGKSISLGDAIENLLIPDDANPDKYVRIGGVNYEFTALNTPLSASDTLVLYSDAYGVSTQNENCAEIAFKDGKVVKVSLDGNMEIPRGGYVLSAAYANTKMHSYAKRALEGQDALLSFAGNDYSYFAFQFTTINGVRSTGYIVIYDGSAGKTTGTNIYGYEIAVDAKGKMVAADYVGNMAIPEGGFVISGHGSDNTTMLAALYTAGADAAYDPDTRTVTVFQTPDLSVYAAALMFEEQKAAFEHAKTQFYSIDYAGLSASLDKAEETLAAAHSAYDAGTMDKAVEYASLVSETLKTLQFQLFESAPVENRATWYRANEKSDEDVYKTVKLMSEMNINAVYIETWYGGKVIGFSDIDLIKHNTGAHGDYDVLEGFCRIGHEYGIEIHIWVENFFIGVEGGELVNATAGHHLVDKKGRIGQPNMYGNFVFLNPYEQYSQDLVMAVYREIVEKYDIDGIHLDYIRFLSPNDSGSADFGYNDDIIAGFQAEYNTTVNPKTMPASGPDWNNWCLFRENIINDWVAKVYAEITAMRPDIEFSSAVSNDYPRSRQTIFQNFNDWVEKGYMDEVFSMSYCTNLDTPAANIKTFMGHIDGRAFFSIGLSAFELSPDHILVKQVQVARDSGAFGENLFSWGSLIVHKENYFDALRAGVYSRPSVRPQNLSAAVAAYAARLAEDADGVYTYLAPLEGDFYGGVKSKATSLLAKANEFDLETATMAEKISYCEETVVTLTALKAYMQTCDNSDVAEAMIKDVEFIVKCLETSLVRLNAQKKIVTVNY